MGALTKTRAIIAALERTVANQSSIREFEVKLPERLCSVTAESLTMYCYKDLATGPKTCDFGCAYALGDMAEERAVVALEHLAAT